MDSPIKERVTAAVALKNKFAAFCSDDDEDAAAAPSEVVNKTAQVKKVEKPSVKKVPKTTATTSSGSKKLSKPEKPEAITDAHNKEGTTTTRGRGRGNGREGTTRDNRREGATRDNRREGTTRDDTRRNNDGRRDENRRGAKTEDEGKNDGNRRRHPPQRQANEAVSTGDDTFLDKTAGDHRATRSDRGTRRPYRGGSRGGGRSDRTGLHDAPKKDGHGKGNWGTEQDELKGETEPIGETNVEKSAQEDNADKNDSGVELEKEEEKPIGMTFSEWKEKNKVIEPETFNVRMPNDDKKLNLAPLKKSEDENKENDEFVITRREPREKHVDISVNFAATDNTASSGGNRGNRDGFRGRKRGGDRGTRGENRNVHNRGSDKNQFNLVNDQFPALGGH